MSLIPPIKAHRGRENLLGFGSAFLVARNGAEDQTMVTGLCTFQAAKQCRPRRNGAGIHVRDSGTLWCYFCACLVAGIIFDRIWEHQTNLQHRSSVRFCR